MQIRFATPNDAAALLAIYQPFIETSATSFETVVPAVDAFASRIAAITDKYPWLLAELDGEITAYAYASRHREREAYQWSVETSVYVHPQFYRQGVARLLYHNLFNQLTQLGYVNVYAGIALPNSASVRLHASLGFEEIGVYKKIGFKFGRWHDVLWLVKYINEHSDNPPLPKNVSTLWQ